MSQQVQRAAAVEQLFPHGVIAHEIRGGAASLDDLFPAEQECVARAVEKRVREFAAGRLCARAGLVALGFDPAPLLMGPDRAPVWPRGIVGSITHTTDYGIAVVAHDTQFKGIGVDVERVGKVDSSLWRLIMRPEELAWLEREAQVSRAHLATMIFGAQEAFYKCQYAITRSWLGFEGVYVRVGGDRFELSVVEPDHPIRRVRSEWVGQFALDDRFVVAAVAAERRGEERSAR